MSAHHRISRTLIGLGLIAALVLAALALRAAVTDEHGAVVGSRVDAAHTSTPSVAAPGSSATSAPVVDNIEHQPVVGGLVAGTGLEPESDCGTQPSQSVARGGADALAARELRASGAHGASLSVNRYLATHQDVSVAPAASTIKGSASDDARKDSRDDTRRSGPLKNLTVGEATW
jgi:hypothetical protein